MRYAIYFSPSHADPLLIVASNWLGRNAFTGEAVETPKIGSLPPEEISYVTAAPRRYGFHATLKAPFRLSENQSERELLNALMHFGSAIDPVTIPRLVIKTIGPFFALVPEAEVPPLNQLANDVVVAFDRFRAPLSDGELARRDPDGLTLSQLKNLHQWGYPHVFEDFRFHMTLTGPIEAQDRPKLQRTIEDFFAPVLFDPVAVCNLALFVEPEPGAPFQIHSLHPLAGTGRRRTA